MKPKFLCVCELLFSRQKIQKMAKKTRCDLSLIRRDLGQKVNEAYYIGLDERAATALEGTISKCLSRGRSIFDLNLSITKLPLAESKFPKEQGLDAPWERDSFGTVWQIMLGQKSYFVSIHCHVCTYSVNSWLYLIIFFSIHFITVCAAVLLNGDNQSGQRFFFFGPEIMDLIFPPVFAAAAPENSSSISGRLFNSRVRRRCVIGHLSQAGICSHQRTRAVAPGSCTTTTTTTTATAAAAGTQASRSRPRSIALKFRMVNKCHSVSHWLSSGLTAHHTHVDKAVQQLGGLPGDGMGRPSIPWQVGQDSLMNSHGRQEYVIKATLDEFGVFV